MGWRVTAFHSRTVPPEPTVASSLPSGLNATSDTRWAWEPVGRGALWRGTGPHSRTVPLLPTATGMPLGLNDTPISLPWVWRGAPEDWRVAGVQSRPVARPASAGGSLPAGLNGSRDAQARPSHQCG